MRILFATTHKHLPELRGGMEVNTHELILALKSRGVTGAVLCGLAGRGWTGLKARLQIKLLGNRCPRDDALGYPAWRSYDSVGQVAQVVKAFRPDVIVLQGGADFDALLNACLATGLPVCCYLHTPDLLPMSAELLAHPKLSFIVNSQCTAALHPGKAISGIVRPLMRPHRYQTETDRSAVVFVNPQPHKGRDTVVAVARARPDIPFVFVSNEREAALALGKQLRDQGLRNVEVIGPLADMRQAYRRARIVIAPSQWLETWGRIATEAHFSGIPVLASDRGGLPEAVGPGGACLPPDAALEQWVAALSRMWDDPQHYAQLSAAAASYARRRDIDVDFIVDSFVALINAGAPARLQA